MQMTNTANEKHQQLVNAFSNEAFQKEINQYRYDIEQELGKFIEWLLTQLESSQLIFRSPESRIKSKAGFSEKISRKDYIHKWRITEDVRDIQDEILKKLPDLIGFRITCFFMKDEEIIYEKLKLYYTENKFQCIHLNFDEKTTQKNGHKIYKVSGHYQDKVSFELQIKSAVHNIWGEVEHKTIYKGSQFAIDLKQRQTITSEVFNILSASDQQLLSLFTHKYTEQDLICGLFAEKTRRHVAEASDTEYLAGHYKSFFDIFLQAERDNIAAFIASSLSGTPYAKTTVEVDDSCTKILLFADNIKDTFLEYYLQVQYNISQELHDFSGYDAFIQYLASTIISTYSSSDEEDPDIIEDDAFSEPEDFEDEGASDSKGLDMLLIVLKDKLPDAFKEGK
jgi:ppGpp synthetase/RelA/SpoT-type nucleotidyltranferase